MSYHNENFLARILLPGRNVINSVIFIIHCSTFHLLGMQLFEFGMHIKRVSTIALNNEYRLLVFHIMSSLFHARPYKRTKSNLALGVKLYSVIEAKTEFNEERIVLMHV